MNASTASLALKTFSDETVRRRAAQQLLRWVTVVEEPDIKVVNNPVDEGYVEVSVATRQGRQLVQRVTSPIGSAEIPPPWDALEQQSTLTELVGALTPA